MTPPNGSPTSLCRRKANKIVPGQRCRGTGVIIQQGRWQKPKWGNVRYTE